MIAFGTGKGCVTSGVAPACFVCFSGILLSERGLIVYLMLFKTDKRTKRRWIRGMR